MREPDEITSYHAHVYYDASTRAAAERLRATMAARFTATVGRLHDAPIGPHPQGMYQVAFAPDQLAAMLPWLMLNRDGLTVLVHPNTGDEVADHERHPLWLGTPLPLDVDFVRRHVEQRAADSIHP